MILISLSNDMFALLLSVISVCFRLFERAVTNAGLEFRSDKLWETYIDWLKETGSRESVMKIALVLDRLLQTPTQHYKRHLPMLVLIFCVLLCLKWFEPIAFPV